MDLTDEQQAALASVQEAFKPDEFSTALEEEAKSYFNPIYDSGHKSGLGEINRKYSSLESERDQLQERAQQLENEVTELRESQPDLQKKRQDWEKNELDPLKEQISDLRSKLTDGKKETVQQKLVSQLQGQTKNDWVAQQAVRQAADRIRVSDDGEVQYLRDDGETPYPSSNGQDPMERFRDDLLTSVPEDLRADNTQGGDRSIDGNGSGGGGQGGDLKRSEMSDKEVSQYIREHGIDEYQKLPK